MDLNKMMNTLQSLKIPCLILKKMSQESLNEVSNLKAEKCHSIESENKRFSIVLKKNYKTSQSNWGEWGVT